MAVTAAVLASGKAVLVKQAYAAGAEPVPLLALRMAIAAPFYLLLLARLPGARPSPRELAALTGVGLAGFYVSATLDFHALRWVSAALERVVLYVHPTLVVLLAAAVDRRPVDRAALPGIAVAWGGLVLAVGADLSDLRPGVAMGVGLLLVSAGLYAGYLVAVERGGRRFGVTRVTAWAQLVSAGALGLHAGLLHPEALARTAAEAWTWGLLLAVVGSVVPSLLLAGAIARVGPARASAMGMVGPFAAALLGAALLGEPLTALQLAGGAVVVLGVAMLPRGVPATGPALAAPRGA